MLNKSIDKTNLNYNERSRVGSLESGITSIMSNVGRLKTAIESAKAELEKFDKSINLVEVAKSHDPLRAYQNAIIPSKQRREILQGFINDMPSAADEVLSETEWYKTQINEIVEAANTRARDIRLLEEEYSLKGDLPPEQRSLLLALKAKSA